MPRLLSGKPLQCPNAKAHEMMLSFPSTPSLPVETLTPHPNATHTGKASRWCPQENSALKNVVWPTGYKRLYTCEEVRQHLRWKII